MAIALRKRPAPSLTVRPQRALLTAQVPQRLPFSGNRRRHLTTWPPSRRVRGGRPQVRRRGTSGNRQRALRVLLLRGRRSALRHDDLRAATGRLRARHGARSLLSRQVRLR